MRNKYKVLIDRMLSDSLWSIKKQARNSITIVGKDSSQRVELSEFRLIQKSNVINIVWKHRGIFGEEKLKFKFPENMDQNDMLDEINKEIGEIVKRKYPFM